MSSPINLLPSIPEALKQSVAEFGKFEYLEMNYRTSPSSIFKLPENLHQKQKLEELGFITNAQVQRLWQRISELKMALSASKSAYNACVERQPKILECVIKKITDDLEFHHAQSARISAMGLGALGIDKRTFTQEHSTVEERFFHQLILEDISASHALLNRLVAYQNTHPVDNSCAAACAERDHRFLQDVSTLNSEIAQASDCSEVYGKYVSTMGALGANQRLMESTVEKIVLSLRELCANCEVVLD